MNNEHMLLVSDECDRLLAELRSISSNPLLVQIQEEIISLKLNLFTNSIKISQVLSPFEKIITDEQTTDFITSLALSSINTFISFNLLQDSQDVDTICNTIKSCQFQSTSDFDCTNVSYRILSCVISLCKTNLLNSNCLLIMLDYIMTEIKNSGRNVSLILVDALSTISTYIFKRNICNDFLEEKLLNNLYFLCHSEFYFRQCGIICLLEISRAEPSKNDSLMVVTCALFHKFISLIESRDNFVLILRLFTHVFIDKYMIYPIHFSKCFSELLDFIESTSQIKNQQNTASQTQFLTLNSHLKTIALEIIIDFISQPNFLINLFVNMNGRTYFPNLFDKLVKVIFSKNIIKENVILKLIIPRIKITSIKQHHMDILLSDGTILQSLNFEKKSYSVLTEFSEKFNENPFFFINNQNNLYTPRKIAQYFLIAPNLSRKQIGEFFGKNKAFCMDTLQEYLNLLDFSKLDFDSSIRLFLSGFQIAGEGQIVDRIFEYFSKRFFACGSDRVHFKSQESVHILSYGWLMMHTSFHNNNVTKKPVFDEFLQMMEKQNNGEDFDEDFLKEVFLSVKNEKVPFEDSEQEGSVAHWRLLLCKQKLIKFNFIDFTEIDKLDAENEIKNNNKEGNENSNNKKENNSEKENININKDNNNDDEKKNNEEDEGNNNINENANSNNNEEAANNINNKDEDENKNKEEAANNINNKDEDENKNNEEDVNNTIIKNEDENKEENSNKEVENSYKENEEENINEKEKVNNSLNEEENNNENDEENENKKDDKNMINFENDLEIQNDEQIEDSTKAESSNQSKDDDENNTKGSEDEIDIEKEIESNLHFLFEDEETNNDNIKAEEENATVRDIDLDLILDGDKNATQNNSQIENISDTQADQEDENQSLEQILSQISEIDDTDNENSSKEPEPKNKESETQSDEIKSENKESEIKNKESETQSDEINSDNKESEIKNKESETQSDEIKSENKESEIKNKESEKRSGEIELENNESEIKNEKSDSKNNETQFENKEPEAKNEESEIKKEDIKSENKESEVKNKETKSESKESKVKNEETNSETETREINSNESETDENEDNNKESEIDEHNSSLYLIEKEMFQEVWKLESSKITDLCIANSEIFDSVCATASKYGISAIVDNFVILFSKNSIEELLEKRVRTKEENMNLFLLGSIIKNHGNSIRNDGWTSLVKLLTTLLELDLLNDEILTFRNIVEDMKPIVLCHKLISTRKTRRNSMFSLFLSRRSSTDDLRRTTSHSNLRDFVSKSEIEKFIENDDSVDSLFSLIASIINVSQEIQTCAEADQMRVAFCAILLEKILTEKKGKTSLFTDKQALKIVADDFFVRVLSQKSGSFLPTLLLNEAFLIILELWEIESFRDDITSFIDKVSLAPQISQGSVQVDMIEKCVSLFLDKNFASFIQKQRLRGVLNLIEVGLIQDSQPSFSLFRMFKDISSGDFENVRFPLIQLKAAVVLVDNQKKDSEKVSHGQKKSKKNETEIEVKRRTFSEIKPLILVSETSEKQWEALFNEVLFPLTTKRVRLDDLILLILEAFEFSIKKLCKLPLFESIWFRLLGLTLDFSRRCDADVKSQIEARLAGSIDQMKQLEIFKDSNSKIWNLTKSNVEKVFPSII